jgi:hypothetical protein
LGVGLVTSESGSRVRSRRRRWVRIWGTALTAVVSSCVPAGAAALTLPGAPEITSAVAGVQSATITFRKPANDGGALVFAYRVTCTSTDGAFTYHSNGAKSPIRVGHLAVRKTYTCRVAARNRLGLGVKSAESAPVIPQVDPHRDAPGPPTSAVATALPASISVHLGPPAYEVDGFTSMHRAVCTSSDGGNPGSGRAEHVQSILVTPLTPGKTYTCYAQNRDQFAWSTASPRSNAVVVLTNAPTLGAPTISSVVPGQRSVTVAFRIPPLSNGGQVYPFRATCTSTDGGVTSTRHGGRSPLVVTGLSLGKTYRCTATAHDHLGWGKPSALSDPVVTPTS